MSRLVFLAGADRLPPGLLPGRAWTLIAGADRVYAPAGHPQERAISEAGLGRVVECEEGSETAGIGTEVWLGGAAEAWQAPGGRQVEVWDLPGMLPGAALLDAVATMDRLRSPGGCPWDAEQTHETLAPYLLEEAYEAVHAIEEGDAAGLREELGDVLLQVLFHARLGEEAAEPFDIDDVAAELVAKLVRRHPHVFGEANVGSAAEVVANWDVIKAAEKSRTSVTQGLPLALPALSLAETLQARAERLGAPPELLAPRLAGGASPAASIAAAAADADAGDGFGELLFTVVAYARARGVDPERALRATNRVFRDRIAGFEHAVRAAGGDPGSVPHEEWHRLW